MHDGTAQKYKRGDYAQYEALVRKAIQGDSEALNDLCGKTAGSVLFQMSYLLGPGDDIEDVTQEVMFRVCKNIRSLSSTKVFKKWLSLIIINEKNRYLKQKLKHEDLVDIDDYLDQLQESRGEHMPDINFENEELRRIIKDLICELPERQKEAVMLRYYNDHSVKDISEIMGIEPNNVSRHLGLAVKNIKSRLKEHSATDEQKTSMLGAAPVGMMLAEVLKHDGAIYCIANEAAIQNISAGCSQFILAESAVTAAAATETACATAETAASTAKTGISQTAIAYICVAALTIATAVGAYLSGAFTPESTPQPPPANIVFYGGTNHGDVLAHVNPERIYTVTENMAIRYWWITQAGSNEVLMQGEEKSTIESALTRLRESGVRGEFMIHFNLYSELWEHTVYQNFYILPDSQSN